MYEHPLRASAYEDVFRKYLARYISEHGDKKPLIEINFRIVEYKYNAHHTAIIPASNDVEWKIDWLYHDNDFSHVFYRKLSHLKRSDEYQTYPCEKPFDTFVPYYNIKDIPPLDDLGAGIIKTVTKTSFANVEAYVEPESEDKLMELLFPSTLSQTQ
jgi:hypothetical protein